MDWDEIKQVPIATVCKRYGVKLRLSKEVYLSGRCPLPSHPEGDKGTPFSIHMPSNTFRCFHPKCCGGQPEDVITFVRLMERLRQPKEAVALLVSWYKKAAPQKEKRQVEEAKISPSPFTPDNTSSSDNGKGFIRSLDTWFDEVFERHDGEADVVYWNRCRKEVKNKVYESYVNGKSGR